MAALFLLFLAMPIVELLVIGEVAGWIGLLPTIALLLADSIFGAWLVKREGLGVWRRVQVALGRGDLPADDLVSGLLILVAGALLLTPGFVTDAIGFVLLVPPTRALVRRSLLARFQRRLERTLAGATVGGPGPWAATWTSGPTRTHVGEAVIVDGREAPAAGRPELGRDR